MIRLSEEGRAYAESLQFLENLRPITRRMVVAGETEDTIIHAIQTITVHVLAGRAGGPVLTQEEFSTFEKENSAAIKATEQQCLENMLLFYAPVKGRVQ